MSARAVVVGAGLAGSEACWQLARRGVRVDLYEMRPKKMTPAHRSADFGELVCSNSLGSRSLNNAGGLLKEELRASGSLVIDCADRNTVSAGGALAVDRWAFSGCITDALKQHPLIELHQEEITEIPDPGACPVVVATGPLTSDRLAHSLSVFTGQEALFFYDAASPIVATDSIDMTHAFRGSRYSADADYINCPLTEDEYARFRSALIAAESAEKHAFEERSHFFDGCLPIEELARRGVDTMRYGPMKPVGLLDPKSQSRPYAVVQLRQDDSAGRMYNIVGFQTSLKWGEQNRVFRMIPALQRAEFLRYGVMHRNTYIHSPSVLEPSMQARKRPNLFFAGQLVGVEGYVESTAMGLVAGINAARVALGDAPIVVPPTTMIGALAQYTATPTDRFQPMNANWGLLPSVGRVRGKRRRNEMHVQRALEVVQNSRYLRNETLL